MTCGSPPGQVKYTMNLYLEKEFKLMKGSDDRAINTLKKLIEASDKEIQLAFSKLPSSGKLQIIGILPLYTHTFSSNGNDTSLLLTHEVDENYVFNEKYLLEHFRHYIRFIKRKRRRIWLNWIEPDGEKCKRCLRL